MSSNETKKTGYIDRFSSTESTGSIDDSMFLNTDLIHEGISDDDLDLLLSGHIKSTANPPKNPAPPEMKLADKDEEKPLTELELIDAPELDEHDMVLIEETEEDLLSVDDIDSELESAIEDLTDLNLTAVYTDNETTDVNNTSSNEPITTTESNGLSSVELEASIDNALNDLVSEPTHNQVNLVDAPTKIDMNAKSIDFDKPVSDAQPEDTKVNPVDIITDELVNQHPAIKESISNTPAPVTKNEPELKTIIHSIPDSVKSRLNNPEVLEEEPEPVVASQENATNTIKVTEKPKTNISPIQVTIEPVKKPVITKKQGNNSMTNTDENALIEKVQVDIDELKRKLHSMNSDFYNAATDSAALISQVRELTTKSSGDFTGTYGQSRELRRVLVEARKVFNQLASGIDMLEESLETDLFEVESK